MEPRTTEDIFRLIDGGFTAAALGAAMELGLFWLLDETPLTASVVAQTLGIPERRCGYWLEILTEAGLLDSTLEGYTPSAVARSTILDAYSQETWAFLAGEVRDRMPVVLDLSHHIRKPESTWTAQGLIPPSYLDLMAKEPDRPRQFTRMLYELHLPLANAVAEFLDMSSVERLMDLGGGSGGMSLALIRRHPHLLAVVVDSAAVCAAGREIVEGNEMVERIEFCPADFLHDVLPSGFDMILECDIGIFSVELFSKLRQSLTDGGRLVIVDQLAEAHGVAPVGRLHWAFQESLHAPEFTYSSVADVIAQLREAGFESLSQTTLPMPPEAAGRFTDGMTVIEARTGKNE